MRACSCLALPNRISDATVGPDARTTKCTLLDWVSSRPFTGDVKVCACAQGASVQWDVFSNPWLAARLGLTDFV